MIIKLQPEFKEKVWGGNKIHTKFGYNTSDNTGEAWGISGHKNGSSTIIDGPYKGKTLRELYQSHKELFGHYQSDEFPILVKIIDATDDLSIQVHPDDAYAKAYENSLGKTECWYILETEENTQIIIGHKAKSKDDFLKHMNNNDFESILNKFPIYPEDTFNIYAGTIHAICKGTLLLEIQQSSDVTYRLYDYNRLSNGVLRDLHIDKAMDVIPFPDRPLSKEKPKDLFDYQIQENKLNTPHRAHIYGDYLFIIDGQGKIDQTPFTKGEFLMISSEENYHLTGDFKYAKVQIN
jgi:mannose-6-phosphate isomerase class I